MLNQSCCGLPTSDTLGMADWGNLGARPMAGLRILPTMPHYYSIYRSLRKGGTGIRGGMRLMPLDPDTTGSERGSGPGGRFAELHEAVDGGVVGHLYIMGLCQPYHSSIEGIDLGAPGRLEVLEGG